MMTYHFWLSLIFRSASVHFSAFWWLFFCFSFSVESFAEDSKNKKNIFFWLWVSCKFWNGERRSNGSYKKKRCYDYLICVSFFRWFFYYNYGKSRKRKTAAKKSWTAKNNRTFLPFEKKEKSELIKQFAVFTYYYLAFFFSLIFHNFH